MLTTGTVLQNRYRIVSLLGQGGMGSVYRAWDMRLSVPVALKEMIPQPELNAKTLEQLREQFHQEAKVLARLNHPHLVRVTDFFEESGNAYLVMDFVEGESLADRINRRGSLPEAEVLDWAQQLLSALTYCHNQGIIHRDVKPQNVIIRPDGQALLVDFGLVKLWDPNDPRTKTVMQGMGTPEYAPPEQYEADVTHTDPRSDIYGLGATIYHALGGQAPLTATLRMAAPERFVPLKQMNPDVSPTTETAVLRALELSLSKRWQSAEEMATALRIGARPAPHQPPERITPVTPPHEKTQVLPDVQAVAAPSRRRGRSWVWILGSGALLSILLCVGFMWVFGRLARIGQASMTATAQAQTTSTSQALAATQAVEMTTLAQAQATSTAEAAQVTATAQAQATAKTQAGATATARIRPIATTQARATAATQTCAHDTNLAPSDWPVIFCDTFNTNANDWYTGEYTGDLITGEKSLTDGKYHWEATAIDGVIWWGIPDMDPADDLYLTVETRRVSGVEDGQYGVIFRRADNDNYGLFKIEDTQYFKFSIRHAGEWDTVVDWTKTTAIRPGETNRLTVLAEGDHYIFYINDQYVGEADEDRLSAGEAGVAIELLDADDAAVFEFDNFEVRTPQ
jgi:tRNA A-37 threonylcarbamoyl transferase component Bud32